ncbi:hypothetical protein I4F81_010105 [Pyropia yezoensis]|uniref:Uncharacterized protein n=1 Tax=Pyropia yezoensis TaxID=2788 RepID=A0ACC3CBQ2_PYRYE|nr:hypothetical protein I4F81_010105 [Neopyropia yezoensis]
MVPRTCALCSLYISSSHVPRSRDGVAPAVLQSVPPVSDSGASKQRSAGSARSSSSWAAANASRKETLYLRVSIVIVTFFQSKGAIRERLKRLTAAINMLAVRNVSENGRLVAPVASSIFLVYMYCFLSPFCDSQNPLLAVHAFTKTCHSPSFVHGVLPSAPFPPPVRTGNAVLARAASPKRSYMSKKSL